MIIGATIGGGLIQHFDVGKAFVFDSITYLLCGILALNLQKIIKKGKNLNKNKAGQISPAFNLRDVSKMYDRVF